MALAAAPDRQIAWNMAARRQASSPYPAVIDRHTGTRICYDPDVVAENVVRQIASGDYERLESELVRRVVRPGDTVLELGAGIGFISALVCRHCRVGSYMAVEPDPRMLPLIRETHRVNGIVGVDLLSAVVTSDPALLAAGTAAFRADRDLRGSHLARWDETGTISVAVVDLQPILRERAISMIIADIEGAEASLFANADLSAVARVFIEVHPQFIGPPGIAALFDQLHGQGLIYDPDRSRGRVVTFCRAG